jgi:hypothetical protein
MASSPSQDPAPPAADLPPSLRFLKGLVIVLMITMILGVITVVWLLVTRMPGPGGAAPLAAPDRIRLPDGVSPRAVTMGGDWLAVVTSDDRILIYNRDGTLRQEVAVAPAD